MDVYSSYIHNCPNLEATTMSFTVGERINCYIQTLDYYSGLKNMGYQAMKKHVGTLPAYFLTERSQSEHAK